MVAPARQRTRKDDIRDLMARIMGALPEQATRALPALTGMGLGNVAMPGMGWHGAFLGGLGTEAASRWLEEPGDGFAPLSDAVGQPDWLSSMLGSLGSGSEPSPLGIQETPYPPGFEQGLPPASLGQRPMIPSMAQEAPYPPGFEQGAPPGVRPLSPGGAPSLGRSQFDIQRDQRLQAAPDTAMRAALGGQSDSWLQNQQVNDYAGLLPMLHQLQEYSRQGGMGTPETAVPFTEYVNQFVGNMRGKGGQSPNYYQMVGKIVDDMASGALDTETLEAMGLTPDVLVKMIGQTARMSGDLPGFANARAGIARRKTQAEIDRMLLAGDEQVSSATLGAALRRGMGR